MSLVVLRRWIEHGPMRKEPGARRRDVVRRCLESIRPTRRGYERLVSAEAVGVSVNTVRVTVSRCNEGGILFRCRHVDHVGHRPTLDSDGGLRAQGPVDILVAHGTHQAQLWMAKRVGLDEGDGATHSSEHGGVVDVVEASIGAGPREVDIVLREPAHK